MSKSLIALDPSERHVLEQWAQGKGRIAERSQIVLRSAESLTAEQVAEQLRIAVPTVYKWRKRFRDLRLSGLRDLPRPGQPRRLSDAQREELVRWTREFLAPDHGHWTIRSLARAASVTEHQVRQAWAASNLRPHVLRAVDLTKHPSLHDRSTSLLGVYIGPPYCALVLKVASAPLPTIGRGQDVARDSRPGSDSLRFGASDSSQARRARRDSVHTTFRAAALPPEVARLRQAERREELLGFLCEVCRHGQASRLHFALSTGGVGARQKKLLEALSRATVTYHDLVTNEAWLAATERWLVGHAEQGGAPAVEELRTSLALHAREHTPEQGATFVYFRSRPKHSASRPAAHPLTNPLSP